MASDPYRVGADPLGKLKDHLEGAVADALRVQDVEMIAMFTDWLHHVEEAEEMFMLQHAELTAIAARADGMLIITEEELRAINGLIMTHQREGAEYRITVSSKVDDAQT